jgi:catechol 2,3-dioxygenase-like lactoylglutathione lyase family enzyme
MELRAALDHVAVAVPDLDVAAKRWAGELGGGHVAHGDNGVFTTRQLRFAGGGKLELIAPSPRSPGGGFVGAFLDRFGPRIHHVTLKVPDLHEAIAVVRDGGYDVVDVQDTDDHWREGFLRPSQVGGLIVQVAWSARTDEEWARDVGHVPVPPAPDAADLHGPLLRHPDLDAARRLWTLLGARVRDVAEGLRCTWPGSPLDVVIAGGEPAGPVALRMAGTGPLPPDADLGAAVLPRPPVERA